MKIKETVKKIKSDYILRGYVATSATFGINVAFFIYNLVIGIVYNLSWNYSIAIYYAVLVLLRAVALFSERKWRRLEEEVLEDRRKKLFSVESKLLLVVDFVMIVPILVMLLSLRRVNIGVIPAISVATYTVYKIVVAIRGYKKTVRGDNLTLVTMKFINIKDALVSVLTLQNTLINVFGDGGSTFILCACTSGFMLIFMILLNVLFIRRGKNFFNKKI